MSLGFVDNLSELLKWTLDYRGQRRAIARMREFDHLRAGMVSVRMRCGYDVLVPQGDRVVARALYGFGEFERRTVRDAIHVSRDASAGRVFVDVGANLGSASLEALCMGFETAVCVEPLPGNARMIDATLALNDLTSRVAVVEAAVSNEGGSLWLLPSPTNSGDNVLVEGDLKRDAAAIQVRVLTVREILAEAQVSPSDVGMYWVDVQGHEPNVVQGLMGLPARPLVLEYTPEDWGSLGTETVVGLLRGSDALWVDVGAMADRPFEATLRKRERGILRSAEELGEYRSLSKGTHTDILILPQASDFDSRGA